MKFPALILLLFIEVVPTGLEAQRIRIATYNVANYNTADRPTDEGYHKQYPKPENAKQALHGVIRAMDADVLAMQEMGSLAHLEELQSDLKNLGIHYPYRYLSEAGDETRHLAVLSRHAFLRTAAYKGIEFSYLDRMERVKRGLLEVVFKTSRGELSLWILHLKSRFTESQQDPESTKRRNAEATAIRDLILRRHPDPTTSLFCVLGDFNDGKHGRPLKAVQAKGAQLITQLLEARDTRGDRWTHFYLRNETYERFDHILVSPALRRYVGRPAEQPDAEAWIVDSPGSGQASDHRPVLVQFCEQLSFEAP